MTRCHLGGAGIVVTRAAHQAESLCRLIADHGGRALRFPALVIEPSRDPAAARERLAARWDWLVFVSANAVEHAQPLLRQPLATTTRIAAIGGATANRLQQAGLAVDLQPAATQTSEGLLAMPALQAVAGQRILIIRGEGGRPLLGDSLRERGAQVAYAEVYRRACPKVDPAPLLAHWQRDIQAVIVTSGELLDNLMALLGASGRERLRHTPLLVVSPRLEAQARALGLARVTVATGASDRALLDALCLLFSVE